MSHDILLLPRRPDQSWQEALDEAEARTATAVPLSPERVTQWDEVTRRLADVMPAAHHHRTLTHLHLVDRDTGVQVHLYADEASVNHPHGDPSDSERLLRTASHAVAVLAEVTGLQPYDPQTDDAHEPHPSAEQTATPEPTPQPQPATRPTLGRSDRLRGLRYLVVGLLLVLGGTVVLLGDDPPGLVWAVLAIGVIDIALAAWTLSGRAPTRANRRG